MRKLLLSACLALQPLIACAADTEPSQMLHVEDARLELMRIERMPKFLGDGGMYTGIQDGRIRQSASDTIDRMILAIINQKQSTVTKAFVLAQFKAALLDLDRLGVSDTEDREAACGYLELVMDALHIESSDGLLNTWLYGFDPS